eukprot:2278539-Prymnesium_polylepis.1
MLKPETSIGGTLETFLPSCSSSFLRSHITFLVNGTMPSSAQPLRTRSSEKESIHGCFAAASDCASVSVAAARSSARDGSRPSAAAFARAAWNWRTCISILASSCAGLNVAKCSKSRFCARAEL